MDLKGALKGMNRAKEEFEKKQKIFEELEERGRMMEAEIPRLEDAIREAEIDKREALEAFVRKELSSEELDKVKAAVDKAKQALIDANELYSAIEQSKSKICIEVKELSDFYRKAEKDVWFEIYQGLKLKIQTSVDDKLLKACVAYECSVRHGYDRMFLDIFGELPRHDRIREMIPKLQAEYFK